MDILEAKTPQEGARKTTMQRELTAGTTEIPWHHPDRF